MKELIIIEQFDNGITIKASKEDDNHRLVAMNHEKEQKIGNLIWETVTNMMGNNFCDTVALEIEYKPLTTDVIS